MRTLQLADPLPAASSTSESKAATSDDLLLILTSFFQLQTITIPRNHSGVPSMDRGRIRYGQSKNTEADQHESTLSRAQYVKLRLRSSQGDDEEALLPAGIHDGSRPSSQQNNSWIGILGLATRSSALAIIMVAAKPNLRTVCIHGSLQAAFWVASCNFSKSLACPGRSFLILWPALCCAEFLLSMLVGLAFCRHFIPGKRVMSSPFLLPVLV